MPKISIIIAIYNTEKYLKQCLTSCINQTLKDIEVICVNDGSTDNSQNIINEYANKDSRMRVIYQENQGLSIARNNGLNIAAGEYVLFLDSDDWLELTACEEAYNQAHENDNDFLIYNYYTYIEQQCKYIESKLNINRFAKIHNINLKAIDDVNYIQTAFVWNKIYKRKWLIDSNIKFIDMEWEDLPFTIETIIKSKSISVIEYPLYFYRQRENSLTKQVSSLGVIFSKDLPLSYILELGNNNLLKAYLNYYFKTLLYWYDHLPMDSKNKHKYEQAMFQSFKKIENIDYRAKLYKFMINTQIYIIYKIIKRMIIIIKCILKKCYFSRRIGHETSYYIRNF